MPRQKVFSYAFDLNQVIFCTDFSMIIRVNRYKFINEYFLNLTGTNLCVRSKHVTKVVHFVSVADTSIGP